VEASDLANAQRWIKWILEVFASSRRPHRIAQVDE